MRFIKFLLTKRLVILMLFGAAVSANDTTLSVDAVLDRIYTPEMRERLKDWQGYESVSEFEVIGLTGTVTRNFLKPNYSSEEIRLGPLSFRQVYNGEALWSVDMNGSVQQLTGAEFKQVVTSAYVESMQFLQPGERALREFNGFSAVSRIGCAEFTFAPDRGESINVWIDTVTGDIVRTFTNFDNIKITTTYSEFEIINGQRVPQVSELESNVPQLNMIARLRSWTPADYLTPDSFKAPKSESIGATLDMPDSVVVGLTEKQGLRFVRVIVNDSKERDFILDTGAGTTLVSATLAKELGLKVVGKRTAVGVTGQSQDMGFVTVETLRIGELTLRDQNISAIDLDIALKDSNIRIDGILGYDFFSKFAVRVNCKRETMTIYEPGIEYSSLGSHELDIELSRSVPLFLATIGDAEGKFLMDLGNTAGIFLHTRFAQDNRFDTLSIIPSGRTHVSGVGASSRVTARRLPVVSIDSQQFTGQIGYTAENSDPISLVSSREVDGNFGIEFWSQFDLIIDYPRRKVWFRPLD